MKYVPMTLDAIEPPLECDDCHEPATWFDEDSGTTHCERHKEDVECSQPDPNPRETQGDLRFHGAL